MTLAIGARLGPYEVVSLLGVGGMGEVYRARDARLGRDVALKVLPEALTRDADRIARFRREARVLAQLNHPHIATIYGLEDAGSTCAIVMELVEGETLSDRLKAHASGLRLVDALSIAGQMADALDAAHEKGIVHRDLKPGNVKITPDGIVKVLDFGLAKAVSDERAGDEAETRGTPSDATRDGVILGTLTYMSPEQARGQPVDRRTDIWAFGCVLYEMLTGRRAFARDTVSDTIAAVLGSTADWNALPAGVPQNIRRLIERCLEKSPRQRLRDIGDARHDLEMSPGADHETPPAVGAGVSRRTVLASAAGLGLLAAGIGGGAALVGRNRSLPAAAYQRLTFRRGMIRTARFAPDFKTILYGALWDGDVCRIYAVRPESPESAPLNLPPAMPFAISASGELALALGTHQRLAMPYGTLARVPIAGGAPREMLEDVKFADWSPDGRDLAVVRRVNGLDRLEFPVGTVIAEPKVPGGGFSFPRVSPRGDAVAVFELAAPQNLQGNVSIVERSGTKRTASPTHFNAFGLAWHGDDVWFTAADELPLFRNVVWAMTPGGAVRTVAKVPGNTSLHDVSPDGRILIARTDDRGGIAVLASGDGVERDLSWLDSSVIGDISPDGRQILFSESGVGGGPQLSTYLRGIDGSPAVRIGDGRAQALSPDGRWAIVRTESPYLNVIPTKAGQTRRLERPGLNLVAARWLPDSRRLVVRDLRTSGGGRLYVVDVDGEGTTPITPDGIAVGAAAWAVSPDGLLVGVMTQGQLLTYPVGGGPARQVPGITTQDSLIGWITRGLLTAENPATAGTVTLIDPASGRRSLWREFRPSDPAGIMNFNMATLVVTPDGQSYAYNWHRAISDLFLVEGWS